MAARTQRQQPLRGRGASGAAGLGGAAMSQHPSLSALLLSAAVVTALAVPPASPATAAVAVVVNSTADPGSGGCDANECTLREAIVATNAAGGGSIGFSLPGPAPALIAPVTALPNITVPTQ